MIWKLVCIALLAAALFRFMPLVVAAEDPRPAAPASGAWTLVGERERLAREALPQGGTPWNSDPRRRAPALSDGPAPRD